MEEEEEYQLWHLSVVIEKHGTSCVWVIGIFIGRMKGEVTLDWGCWFRYVGRRRLLGDNFAHKDGPPLW